MENQNLNSDPQPQPAVQPEIKTTPQPIPVSAPIKPKKAWKKWILIILILILVLSLPLGGYLLLGKMGIHPKPSTITIQNIKPTPTPDPTANWKTYENTKYNYALKYPADWKIATLGNAEPTTFISPFFESPCNFDAGDTCMQLNIQVSPSDGSLNPSFTVQSNDNITNKLNLKIDGVLASGFVYNQALSGKTLYVIVTIKNDSKYTITYEVSEKNKVFNSTNISQYKNILNLILSTFKFTNQNSTTDASNWKTYTGKYFSLKYPQNWFISPANQSVTISDIQTPGNIPSKEAPDGHQVIHVGFFEGAMPTTYPYTNGSDKNTTIKPFSVNGYTGIKGQQTSTVGLNEVVDLKNPTGGYFELINEIEPSINFENILATFKIN